jgi:hypothetical protein
MAPLAFWSVAPAMASAADFCEPMALAVTQVSHACCEPADSAASESPAGCETETRSARSAQAAASGPGHASMPEAPAPHSHAGRDCRCQPADLPGMPESEAPATTLESGSQRNAFGTAFATLTSAAIRSDPGLNGMARQDRARRFASSPPLYLLHELLLI